MGSISKNYKFYFTAALVHNYKPGWFLFIFSSDFKRKKLFCGLLDWDASAQQRAESWGCRYIGPEMQERGRELKVPMVDSANPHGICLWNMTGCPSNKLR